MAYCDRCGAYVPDGQTRCFACGYDPAAPAEIKHEAPAAAASAAAAEPEKDTEYAYSYRAQSGQRTEELKKTLEAERLRQKENARKWAEEAYIQQHSRVHKVEPEESRQNLARDGSSANTKILSVLSYISIFCLLPFLFAPNDEKAKFHGRQGLVLFITTLIGNLVGRIFNVGWVVTLISLFLTFKGVMNAARGEQVELPLIGHLAEKNR